MSSWAWLAPFAFAGCASSADASDVSVDARVEPVLPLEQGCPPGEFVRGIDATGAVVCEALVLPAINCAANRFVAGIDELGNPICKAFELSTDIVRDYVNEHCYLYVGWRDSCDGCTDAPVKFARTRGTEPGCSVEGGASGCGSFTLFDRPVQMAGLNTDGDVNDDDKFWFGLACD